MCKAKTVVFNSSKELGCRVRDIRSLFCPSNQAFFNLLLHIGRFPTKREMERFPYSRNSGFN